MFYGILILKILKTRYTIRTPTRTAMTSLSIDIMELVPSLQL